MHLARCRILFSRCIFSSIGKNVTSLYPPLPCSPRSVAMVASILCLGTIVFVAHWAGCMLYRCCADVLDGLLCSWFFCVFRCTNRPIKKQNNQDRLVVWRMMSRQPEPWWSARHAWRAAADTCSPGSPWRRVGGGEGMVCESRASCARILTDPCRRQAC